MQNGAYFVQEHTLKQFLNRINVIIDFLWKTHVFAIYHDKLLDCRFQFYHILFAGILLLVEELSMEFHASSKPMYSIASK